jgi:hypothetical protein
MANIKKGAVANLVFPMVDKTDFASIESGITASDFNSAATKKFFGVNHATASAFISGTISKATTLVRSGIFQQELKTTETNYDYMLYQFKHASCADQLLVFQTVTYDDSDMYSYVSDLASNIISMVSDLISLASDIDSQVLLNASMISNTWSLVSDVDSQLTINYDLISDVESQVDLLATSDYLSKVHSDLYSAMGNVSATIGYSDISDIASAVWADPSGSQIVSDISDIKSAIEAGVIVNISSISDITSAVEVMIETAIIPLGASNISDIASRVWAHAQAGTSDYLSKIHSDLVSAIGNVSVVLTASDISDIASAVTAAGVNLTASDMSDIASRVWATNEGLDVISRISDLVSMVSDVDSQLTLNATALTNNYNLISDVDSQVLLNASMISDIDSQLTLTVSALSDVESAIDALNDPTASDVASAIWGEKYNTHSGVASSFGSFVTQQIQGASNLLSNISALVSDVDSQLTLNATALTNNYNLISDVDSQVLLNASMISDAHSDLRSYLVGMSGALSDVESQVDLLTTSDYSSKLHSDLYSAIGNVSVTLTASDISDIASAVTAAGVNLTASDMSDIASRVWATTIGANVDNRISVLVSMVSDVESQVDLLVTSDYMSAVHSDLASAIGAVTATLSSDAMSDIAVEVWAHATGVNVDNRVSALVSQVSDIDSQVLLNASLISDVDSQITLNTATLSTLASLVSDVDSQLTVNYDLISDVDSQLTVNYDLISDVDSQVNANYELISDVDSQLTLTQSALSDVESAVDALFTTAITESYSADGAAPTVAQALSYIMQILGEFSISGTTLTVKKLDGSTEAMTFTLDDATNPTSITRAT